MFNILWERHNSDGLKLNTYDQFGGLGKAPENRTNGMKQMNAKCRLPIAGSANSTSNSTITYRNTGVNNDGYL